MCFVYATSVYSYDIHTYIYRWAVMFVPHHTPYNFDVDCALCVGSGEERTHYTILYLYTYREKRGKT